MTKPDSSTEKPAATVRKRSLVHPWRLAFLLLVLALVTLAEPHVFRFVVTRAIMLEAWRNGASLTIDSVAGSAWEPLVFSDARCTARGKTGTTTRFEIAHTDLRLSWKHLFRGDGDRWVQRLTLSGVTGKVTLPDDGLEPPPKPLANPLARLSPPGVWLPRPACVEVCDVDFIVERGADSVTVEGGSFVASELEPGYLRISRLTVKQPWLDRVFLNVRGTTKLQDTKLLIADLRLDPAVEIRSLSADLAELANGRIDFEIQAAAFGGEIHGEAQTIAHEHPFTIEASVTFAQIGIAPLAAFLGAPDSASGTIKEGKLTFRGSPRQSEKAAASLWLAADHFQWDSRQWDSLEAGFSLMDRRVRVTKFALHQGHNQLDLSGEMALPTPGVKWWQSEFSCDVTAKIDEMAGLSELLLPEFKFAAGRLKIDGSIRRRDQQFSGQLIVSGSDLKWRDAPIENLHAAVRLHGNECEFSNVELFNRGDYIRGRGVVNIVGATQYWGELRGSVDELATYASILQKPIVPEPMAGGAVVEWSGEGSTQRHSGKFRAKLKMLRSLGALAAQLHPINADLEATYASDGMQFSQVTLADEQSSLSAKVDVGNKALALRGMRLVTGSQLTLEGDATLPLDVWREWPNTSLDSLINSETTSAVKLIATNLDLHSASQLTGWNFPIAGTVNGAISATGPISALVMNGKFTLAGGQIPLGADDGFLSNVESAVTFHGAEISVEKFTAAHRLGEVRVAGTVDLKNVRDPGLKLRLESENASLPIFTPATGIAGNVAPEPAHEILPAFLSSTLALELTGPCSNATLHGDADITNLDIRRMPDLSALWRSSGMVKMPAPAALSSGWKSCRLDIAVKSSDGVPIVGVGGIASIDAHLGGTSGAPLLTGSAQISALPISGGPEVDAKTDATFTFHENRPHDPTLDLRVSGTAFGEPFTACLAGPLSHPVRWYLLQPPLTESLIEAALRGGAPVPPGRFPGSNARVALRAPAPLLQGIVVFDWAPISNPDAPAMPVDAGAAPISKIH